MNWKYYSLTESAAIKERNSDEIAQFLFGVVIVKAVETFVAKETRVER